MIRHRTTIATANLATWSGGGSGGAMSPAVSVEKKLVMESYVEFMCISVYIYICIYIILYTHYIHISSCIIIYHHISSYIIKYIIKYIIIYHYISLYIIIYHYISLSIIIYLSIYLSVIHIYIYIQTQVSIDITSYMYIYIYTHTCFAWFGHFFMPSKWSCFPLLEMATCEAWRHVFLLKWLCNPFWKTASLGFYKQVLQVIASVSMSMRLSIFTYSPIPLFPYFPISDLFTYLPIYQPTNYLSTLLQSII